VSARRGLTIAETLVVSVILGLMLLAIAGAMAPLLSAPARAQAKTDSLSPASAGLYLFERDLRESDANVVFACTGWPAVCGSGSIETADSAVVIATAYDSADLAAQFQTFGERPAWQGFIVYWQRAPGGDVYRTYEPAPAASQFFDPSQAGRSSLEVLAQDAAAAAQDAPDPQIAMRDIATLSAAVNTTSGITSLHMVASGAAGYQENTSTFDDDVWDRN
jgi:hypothetical protein